MNAWWRRGRSDAERDELLAELRRPQNIDDGRLLGTPKSAVRASLAGADLSGADLRQADLQYCNLRKADLSGARFDGADLSWATLDGADLTNATFGRARLVETVMHGADLTGTDLSRVTGLTFATVRGVSGARSARWPPGFDPSPPRVAGPLLHPNRD
jgi:uncharacterized protein YjbI with pentapeptide repeats